MAVLLNRPYLGFTAGSVVELPASTEAAIVAQNIGAVSAAAVTAGALTTQATTGECAIAAAATSVVITNPNVDITSKIWAQVAQTAADATLTSIVRVVPAAGSFTIFGNAAATAATVVNWALVNGNPNPFN